MKKRLLSVRASGLVLIAAWMVLAQVAGALITDTRAATEELNQQAECPAPETPPPPGIPVLCFNARASAPSSVEAGQPFAVDVALENAAGTDANNLIVDIEITNQAGSRVAQHYLYDRLLVGESKSYTAEFTLDQPGLYQVRLGVFTGDWSYMHQWFSGLAFFEVTPPSQPELMPPSETPEPSPTPTPSGPIRRLPPGR